MSVPPLLRWATRSHSALARFVLRRQPGEIHEMHQDASRLIHEASAHGTRRLLLTWTALVWDALISGWRYDIGQAVRTVLRSPASTIATSVVLGVGLAVTATLFAIVDAVLLRPLPYDQPERLVMIWEAASTQDRLREGPAPGNVVDWVRRDQSFDALTAWMTKSLTLRGRDGATPVTGVQVTRGFFEVFRRPPLLGRTFSGDDYAGAAWNVANQFVGREPIAVISHRLWRQLGADASIVGATLQVEGRAWRVVGVMPPDFAAPDTQAALWTPWDMTASYAGPRFPEGPPRDFRFLRVVGRLKEGVSLEQGASQMQSLAAALADEHPQSNRGWSVRLVPLADEIVGESRADLVVLFSAVLCLLLLVCTNIAGLALARAASRSRELAVRGALRTRSGAGARGAAAALGERTGCAHGLGPFAAADALVVGCGRGACPG